MKWIVHFIKTNLQYTTHVCRQTGYAVNKTRAATS